AIGASLSNYAGAILCSGSITINDTKFIGNASINCGDAGAIGVRAVGNGLTLDGCSFYNNHAEDNGAVSAPYSYMFARRCIFMNNTSNCSSNISCRVGYFENCLLARNTIGGVGAGAANGTKLTFRNCSLAANGF